MKCTLKYWALFAVLFWVGCSHNSSPRDTAAYAVSCMQADDLNGLFSIVESDESNRDEKLALVKAYHEAFNEVLAQNQGIEGYELVWEHINKEKCTAVVRMMIIFGNGKSSEINFFMAQDKEGRWFLEKDELVFP